MFRRTSRTLTRSARQSNTMCPVVECSTGEEYKPKAGQVILSPFGPSSIVIPKFFLCARENRIGASLFPSTSTLVEHGGVVGKL